MVEQGFVGLLTQGLNDSTVQIFPVELPKDWVVNNQRAITYRSILSTPTYLLNGQEALTKWQVQVDCHAVSMSLAISLARGVDGVLRNSWRGFLPNDPDKTFVQMIKRLPTQVDGYSDISRTFVRSLEYQIIYLDK